MPFKLLAASDVCASYRKFVSLNFHGCVEHIFESLEEQLRPGSVCELCAGRRSPDDFVSSQTFCHDYEHCGIDLLMTGTPCNPFSTMRSKRYATDMLQHHSLFDVTMQSAIKLYTLLEPKRGIFEQVWGFCQPIHAGATETPKDRLDILFFRMSVAKILYVAIRCFVEST